LVRLVGLMLECSTEILREGCWLLASRRPDESACPLFALEPIGGIRHPPVPTFQGIRGLAIPLPISLSPAILRGALRGSWHFKGEGSRHIRQIQLWGCSTRFWFNVRRIVAPYSVAALYVGPVRRPDRRLQISPKTMKKYECSKLSRGASLTGIRLPMRNCCWFASFAWFGALVPRCQPFLFNLITF